MVEKKSTVARPQRCTHSEAFLLRACFYSARKLHRRESHLETLSDLPSVDLPVPLERRRLDVVR